MADADEIRRIERQRLEALVAGDTDLAMELHADDYQLVTPGGATQSRQQYLDGIQRGELRYHRFEPAGEIAVRLYETAAIVRYQVDIDITFPGGRDVTRCWHTDLYELREGRWQAVWSHATRIG